MEPKLAVGGLGGATDDELAHSTVIQPSKAVSNGNLRPSWGVPHRRADIDLG